VGGDTGLEACPWNPDCSFLGETTYGDNQGCSCGCGVIDSDCPAYGGEDGGETYYDVADCVENACTGDSYLNPENPAECLTPEPETDAGTTSADAGSSDGNVDGTISVDAGSDDGASDGTVAGDAGSSDGASDGAVAADAGSSDGDDSTEDAGAPDEPADAGSSDGASDGTVIVADAGSSDGDSTEDAGAPDETADAGNETTDPCDDYECEEGYVCMVEYGECLSTDAGIIDAGTDTICTEDEVYCLEIVDPADAGSEPVGPADAGETTEPTEPADAGETTEPTDPVDAGDSSEVMGDAGVPFEPDNGDYVNTTTTTSSPSSCNCSSSEAPAHQGKWFIMGLLFLGWRLRRKR
jgi:hypothetical protein